ncbi:hypothetical protein TrVE_jg2121 [Triparma verrucosa]|uniref:EF-hand domain-containing protein n=1 Tax=Triparma verrucosa TaxID=1606542 RepID=A0A9W7F369_9STRA|nr:hypothetical protein TrVE_jg2121 [Triparma verrucosa]
MPSFLTGLDDAFDSTPPSSTSLGPVSPHISGRSPGHRLSKRQHQRNAALAQIRSGKQPKSRQAIREEEDADRLGRVRHEFNRSRLHHKLRLEEPEFDKVAKLSLPLIQRDPSFRLPSGRKSRSAKKRWKKTKTIMKDVVGAITMAAKNAQNSSPNQTSRSLQSRGEQKSSPTQASNLFSPLKRKGNNKRGLSTKGEKFHSNLEEDTFQTRHVHSEKQGSAQSGGGKPPLIAKPRIMPVSKTKLEKRNRRKLNTKEREKQLKKNTRMVDEMMYELESKPTMTDEDIGTIIAFMDFNGSGEVDEEEFSGAIRAAKRGQISDEVISALMARVDNELRIKQIRVKDLFKQLDQSGDGVLSTEELRFGLNMLCDVSWEKECERRKLKRQANHERWKVKEEVRDKTKKWLVEGEQLPREFMKDRDYFCRDISTPERFTKYLEVVVSGPTHTKEIPRSPKRATMNGRQTEEMKSFFTFAFDPESLEDESTHDSILQIVDDEMSIESAKNGGDEDSLGRASRASRKSRRTRGTRGTRKSYSTRKKAAEAKAEVEREIKLVAELAAEEAVGDESSIATNESRDASSLTSLNTGVTFSTLETGTLATQQTNLTYKSTISANSAAMLGQIRRSRGVKEQSDSEIESMIMLLGLNRRSVLSMKQRHFEERTFKNLYSARTSSLSNDYYLPQSVSAILEREELIASGGKKGRRASILKIIKEQEAKIQEEERLRKLREEYYDLYDDDDDSGRYGIYEDNDDSSIGDSVSLGESTLGEVSVLGYDDSTIGSVGSEDYRDTNSDGDGIKYEIPHEITL